jgi:hypothetical protein
MVERDTYRVLIADPIVEEGMAVLRGADPSGLDPPTGEPKTKRP